MAPIYRHGGHRVVLALGALAAGTSSDTGVDFVYDGEAPSILGTVDRSVEVLQSAVLVCDAAVTGAATNYFEVAVSLYRAGTKINEVLYSFASGVDAAAHEGIDLSGAAAGGLTVPTGVAILGEAWQLEVGDVISVQRLSAGTGAASPGFGVTLKIGSLGS